MRKTLHLTVTNLCDRDCKYCCNKQYNVENLEYVTDKDFRNSNILCLTGGEPFTYSNPCNISKRYREKYPHLKMIVVYTNAYELYNYISWGGILHSIDGLNISCKTEYDATIFNERLRENLVIQSLPHNRVYDFTGKVIESKGFEIIHRTWQKNFIPAENCIFKRGN